ncbi:uncharacterized protein EAF01_003725 [Botrytis porri]|uniref:uncharacterized protein n=1 Tax=Botrytis porri TaxID=87229 RepID=UPI001901C95B|nr:uncharacterized protein EAF01_003725 [Botrytis porri]KAF7910007.1 hypothetical protein EAF01_003725 [Botrytis porri]
MTSNDAATWNAGDLPSDGTNLVDWSFDINEMSDWSFGDLPSMAPTARTSSGNEIELHSGPTEGTAITHKICCQCANVKSFETMMDEIRKVVAQAREDQMDAVEKRITSLEARAVLVEGIVQDVKEGAGKFKGRLDRYTDEVDDLHERIDKVNKWLGDAHEKVEFLMDMEDKKG